MKATMTAMLVCSFLIPAPAQSEEYPKAYVSHLAPYQVAGGALFSIIGAGFGDSAGEILVGESNCEVVSWSDRMVRARAPKEAIVEKVTVKASGGTYTSHLSLSVSYRDPGTLPTIAEVELPSQDAKVSHGDTITLRGSGFGSESAVVSFPSASNLSFPVPEGYPGAPVGTVESWKDAEIVVTVPETCDKKSHVLVELPGFVLLAPTRVICPAASQ